MKGSQEYTIDKGNHRIEIATKSPMLLSLNGTPEKVIGAGNSKFVLKTEEKATIGINPTDKSEYKFKVTSYESSRFETIDHEPPPEPPSPQSWLGQLRLKHRREMGITREDFANFTSIYETGNVHQFEEEMAQAKTENAKAASGEPSPAPTDETPESVPETPSENNTE